ncbi:protein of unknown function [Streptomyces sp. KY75]|nr:protein of unknown function [Streptomyces sp. KY70]CAD5992832.1 protein of unknown function [Streptomyces sp. KY75]
MHRRGLISDGTGREVIESPCSGRHACRKNRTSGLMACVASFPSRVEATNAEGAAGFPFPPADLAQTASAVEAIIAALAPETSRLLVVHVEGELAVWLNVRRDPFELVRHWGSGHHVQTRPAVRGRGLGMQLMREVRTLARKEMGLEQLHLAARAGVGPLPGSSTSCGESPMTRLCGRRPSASSAPRFPIPPLCREARPASTRLRGTGQRSWSKPRC